MNLFNLIILITNVLCITLMLPEYTNSSLVLCKSAIPRNYITLHKNIVRKLKNSQRSVTFPAPKFA